MVNVQNKIIDLKVPGFQVGYRNHRVVRCENFSTSHTDFSHFTLLASDFDPVARSVAHYKKSDNSRNQTADIILERSKNELPSRAFLFFKQFPDFFNHLFV